MTDDLDSRIKPDRELNDDDCFTLWAAHIKQRISDATGMPVKGMDRVAPTVHEQQEARSWLLNPSMSLALACDAVGVNMEALIELSRERAISNWQLQ